MHTWGMSESFLLISAGSIPKLIKEVEIVRFQRTWNGVIKGKTVETDMRLTHGGKTPKRKVG